MNQAKLEVVKRDGKSEHQHSRNQQTKMDWNGEFNSDDHYIYYCRQESLRREFASWTEPGVVVDTDKQDLDLEFL